MRFAYTQVVPFDIHRRKHFSHRALAFATCLSLMLLRAGWHKYHVFNDLALPHRDRPAVPTGTLQGSVPVIKLLRLPVGRCVRLPRLSLNGSRDMCLGFCWFRTGIIFQISVHLRTRLR
jgi:hypothetical protein